MFSPYTTPAVTVYFGKSRSVFTVQHAIVDQYPGLKEKLNSDNSIMLDMIEENIGHTLIHFIYTSRYQTLKLDGPDQYPAFTHFKRALFVYCAARLCGITKLEEYIKGKADELQKQLSLFDLQTIAEEVCPKLPQQENWFSANIQKWVEARLLNDATLLTGQRLPDVIGRSVIFDKAVVKSLMDMYIDKGAVVELPVANGDHVSPESELTLETSKAESVADCKLEQHFIARDADRCHSSYLFVTSTRISDGSNCGRNP
jgi:hypothetical protein